MLSNKHSFSLIFSYLFFYSCLSFGASRSSPSPLPEGQTIYYSYTSLSRLTDMFSDAEYPNKIDMSALPDEAEAVPLNPLTLNKIKESSKGKKLASGAGIYASRFVLDTSLFGDVFFALIITDKNGNPLNAGGENVKTSNKVYQYASNWIVINDIPLDDENIVIKISPPSKKLLVQARLEMKRSLMKFLPRITEILDYYIQNTVYSKDPKPDGVKEFSRIMFEDVLDVIVSRTNRKNVVENNTPMPFLLPSTLNYIHENYKDKHFLNKFYEIYLRPNDQNAQTLLDNKRELKFDIWHDYLTDETKNQFINFWAESFKEKVANTFTGDHAVESGVEILHRYMEDIKRSDKGAEFIAVLKSGLDEQLKEKNFSSEQYTKLNKILDDISNVTVPLRSNSDRCNALYKNFLSHF